MLGFDWIVQQFHATVRNIRHIIIPPAARAVGTLWFGFMLYFLSVVGGDAQWVMEMCKNSSQKPTKKVRKEVEKRQMKMHYLLIDQHVIS